MLAFFVTIFVATLSFGSSAEPCALDVKGQAKLDQLRVAAVQYAMTRPASVEAWESRLEGYVRRAGDGGAAVVLFPELISIEAMALLDPKGEHPEQSIRQLAKMLTPRFKRDFALWSERFSITIIAGSWPTLEEDAVYNMSSVFSQGTQIHSQTKNHLTQGEIDYYKLSGGSTNSVPFVLPGGVNAAIAICFDSEFPNYLPAEQGTIPEVIFVPSMTSDPEGRFRVARSASARAVEYHAYVVVTGTVGGSAEDPALGANTGQAKVFQPSDTLFPGDGIANQGTLDSDEILFTDLDLKRLRTSREMSTVFPAKILHPPRP